MFASPAGLSSSAASPGANWHAAARLSHAPPHRTREGAAPLRRSGVRRGAPGWLVRSSAADAPFQADRRDDTSALWEISERSQASQRARCCPITRSSLSNHGLSLRPRARQRPGAARRARLGESAPACVAPVTALPVAADDYPDLRVWEARPGPPIPEHAWRRSRRHSTAGAGGERRD